MKIQISIPEGLDFKDLKLERDPITKAVAFSWGPVEKICELNKIDIGLFKNSPEGNVAGLLVAWYFAHLENGGAPDLVAEQLTREVMDEDRTAYERRN